VEFRNLLSPLLAASGFIGRDATEKTGENRSKEESDGERQVTMNQAETLRSARYHAYTCGRVRVRLLNSVWTEILSGIITETCRAARGKRSASTFSNRTKLAIDRRRRRFRSNRERIDIPLSGIPFVRGRAIDARTGSLRKLVNALFPVSGIDVRVAERSPRARRPLRKSRRRARSSREIAARWFPQFRGRSQERIGVFGRAGIIWPRRRPYVGIWRFI